MTPSTCYIPSPTQRDQLEYVLVSGAAMHLATHTHLADKIAAGIKTVLDALHPAPPVAPIAKPDGCQGTNCASVNGLNHSRECITEAAATQGWTPTAEDFSKRMTFGAAIEALKAGQSVARAGWNGKGMFVYLVPAASYPAQTGAAKTYFGKDALVPYAAYLALKNVDGTVNTWAPSVSDALAEDWALAP